MRRLFSVTAVLAALLLLAGCRADSRHEIYRVYQGQNGDWTLEVRLWVVYNDSPLLPADLEPDDSGTYTRTYWKLEYHGDMTEEELHVIRTDVGSDGISGGWSYGTESGGGSPLEFDKDKYWLDDNSYTNGIDVGDAEACYAIVTDADGRTVRIDAPLTKTKG
jgi:hypothetical protein